MRAIESTTKERDRTDGVSVCAERANARSLLSSLLLEMRGNGAQKDEHVGAALRRVAGCDHVCVDPRQHSVELCRCASDDRIDAAQEEESVACVCMRGHTVAELDLTSGGARRLESEEAGERGGWRRGSDAVACGEHRAHIQQLE